MREFPSFRRGVRLPSNHALQPTPWIAIAFPDRYRPARLILFRWSARSAGATAFRTRGIRGQTNNATRSVSATLPRRNQDRIPSACIRRITPLGAVNPS